MIEERPEELERAEDQVLSIVGIDSGMAKTDEAEAPIGHRTDPEVASHVSGGQTAVVCVTINDLPVFAVVRDLNNPRKGVMPWPIERGQYDRMV